MKREKRRKRGVGRKGRKMGERLDGMRKRKVVFIMLINSKKILISCSDIHNTNL